MKGLSFEEEKQKLIEVSELYQNFGDNSITCDEFNSIINLLDEY